MQLSILYDKISGQLKARLMVEVKPRKQEGSGRVAIDLGQTILMACAFDDGTASLYSGRQIYETLLMKGILQELVTLVAGFWFQIESIEVYPSALAVGKCKRMETEHSISLKELSRHLL